MNADMINMGYAAGYAAAMAVESGQSLRQLDLRPVQDHLVQIGNLTPEHLSTARDAEPPTEAVLKAAAADINGDGVKDLVAGGRQARNATPSHEDPDPTLPSVGVIWIEAPIDPAARRDMAHWRVHDIDSDIISGHGFHLGDLNGDGKNLLATVLANRRSNLIEFARVDW